MTDSTKDTLAHIQRVRELMTAIIENMIERASVHDETKLQSPEKELFDEWSPKLSALEYGSDEYKKALDGLGPALRHHYEHNSHHPEHYDHGIYNMSFMDLLEMLADWKAAGERHNTGSMEKSMKVNRDRFMIGDVLFVLLNNTLQELGW